jgi:tetratricopeptide (TPR) repeat protein
MRQHIRLIVAGCLLALVANAQPCHAAGGESGGGGQGGGEQNGGSTPSCPPGYVAKSGMCAQATTGVLPDDELYRQGRALALAHRYAEALPILLAIGRTDDSMVYTMRGYALRKLGRVREGLDAYAKALALAPDNVNTHEYLGEYYVESGNLAGARAQLARVEALCGRGCDQYEDLSLAIRTGAVE